MYFEISASPIRVTRSSVLRGRPTPGPGGGSIVATFRALIAGIVLIATLVAANLAIVPTLKDVPFEGTKLAFIASLPMANLVAACLAIGISRLIRWGEVMLPLIMFGLVGGSAILLVLLVATVAPWSFFDYISLTAGLYRGPRQNAMEIHRFGMVATGPVAMLVVYGVIAVPQLVPAMLGSWMTRGYLLRLSKGSAAGE
jgi:hypothetical protein